MNEDYIAGFFDGEGSGMVLTDKRCMKSGIIFRFRPVIRISQNTRSILDDMVNYLSFGYVTKSSGKGHVYVVNGLDSVLLFIERIMPHCHLKKDVLLKVQELALFQKNTNKGNAPYSLDETLKLIELRDQVFKLNQKTRSGVKQKYPKETILNETTFYTDTEWMKLRINQGKQLSKYAGIYNKKQRKQIECACDCGGLIVSPNKYGRDKKYIKGHNQKGKKWKWNK